MIKNLIISTFKTIKNQQKQKKYWNLKNNEKSNNFNMKKKL